MQYDWLGDLKHLLACPEQIETFAAQFAARVAAPHGGGAIEDRAVAAPDGSGSLTTRITALIAQFDELPEDLQDVARNFPESKALLAWLTKAASAPAQAGEAVACADCEAGHPRYFVTENGGMVHTLPGGAVNFCANADAPQGGAVHPCAKCGVLRTEAEGGTTFTVCDECWDAKHGAPQGGGEAWARSPAFFGVVFAARVAADGQSLTMEGRVKALADLAALERQRPIPSPAGVVEARVPLDTLETWLARLNREEFSGVGHIRAAMEDAIAAAKPAQEPPRAKSAEGGEGAR